MSYKNQFQKHLHQANLPAFLSLWEEYCLGDEVDPLELKAILFSALHSSLSQSFGRYVKQIVPLWEKLKESPEKHEIIKLIFDIQTTNAPQLADLAINYLQNHFKGLENLDNKLRFVGLKEKKKFQRCIRDFELLCHFQVGNFVFHSGGWGVGEIMAISSLREVLSLEFEGVPGLKELSFKNACNTLAPLKSTHFLARRFGNPDQLEKEAKKDAVGTMCLMLKDLGPLHAAQVREELYELVIPKNTWQRWWQTTRAKIKKDTRIDFDPSSQMFTLSTSTISHEHRLLTALENADVPNTIHLVHTFLRDFPNSVKNTPLQETLIQHLKTLLTQKATTESEELQVYFLLQDILPENQADGIEPLIQNLSNVGLIVKNINIATFKKRLLVDIHALRKDWGEIFSQMLLEADTSFLRDYVLTQLLGSDQNRLLKQALETLITNPQNYPQALIWYFQKVMKNDQLPLSDSAGKVQLFESFLILLNHLENIKRRDLIKKMHQFLSAGRYKNVRAIMQLSKIEEVREFLLLATKCHSLSDHDIKIFYSLAEVVHPSLKSLSNKYTDVQEEPLVIWTTKEGYLKTKNRIQEIATVETVENAKEIEEARALGDLRENAEFKSALERRERLQGELRFLSDQFKLARILTNQDIDDSCVGIGTKVTCKNDQDQTQEFVILGPWDANPDQGILSFQSRLAKEMEGKKIGETFSIQGKTWTITLIQKHILD